MPRKRGKHLCRKVLDDFGKKLAIVIMIISTIVFVLRICQKQPILDSLMFAVALAVAAIPEALSSIVTVCASHGNKENGRGECHY